MFTPLNYPRQLSSQLIHTIFLDRYLLKVCDPTNAFTPSTETLITGNSFTREKRRSIVLRTILDISLL